MRAWQVKTVSLFQGVRSRWNDFWFSEMPPQGLAAFRILMGFYLLAYFFRFLPHVELNFASSGVYVPFLIPDIAPPPAGAWVIYSLTLVAIALFTLGLWARWVTPVVLLAFVYHWCLCLAVRNTSYDRLIILFLLVACFGTLDGVWSISRGRAKGVRPVIAWPGRLITFQLAALYFGAGLWKILTASWHTGRMMEMTLVGPYGTGVAFWFVSLDWPTWFYAALTWGVVIFELAAGVLLYVPRVQKWVMVLGFLFHLSIWVFLNIPEFLVCVAVYPLFLRFRDNARPGRPQCSTESGTTASRSP